MPGAEDEAVRRRNGAHASSQLLIEPRQDRWRWRRRIRENPSQLRIYRAGVGVAGLFLILLGCATGWLPGPGGIPLVLLGLAVWASEFEWANRLLLRFKGALRRYQSWSRRGKVVFWAGFLACCALLGYGYLLVLGTPGWFPDALERLFARLPGV